jgi:photosystem II stability/assembly factor-like uncharacterized protein
MFLPVFIKHHPKNGQRLYSISHIVFLLFLMFFFAVPAFSQFKQVHLESNENSHVEKMDFYSGAEGYIAFTKTLGFTTDSGKTVAYKPITLSNVNYNGYQVNLTFGFELSGVKAFDRNRLLVYGSYALVPAILYSADGGNTFQLVFHSQPNDVPDSFVRDMAFPGNGSIGYAVDTYRVLKTTDGGLSWTVNFRDSGTHFTNLQAVSDKIVHAFNTEWPGFNARYVTTDGGGNWEPVYSNTGINYLCFFNANVAWLNTKDGKVFTSADGGNNWTVQNNIAIAPINLSKMIVVNDSTAYGMQGFEVYKTSNKGKIWERLHRDNNYSYLGYSLNDIQLKGNAIWAGGAHGYLALSGNSGGKVVPRAYFTIDETQAETTGNIKLTNYSKSGNNYKWLVNGKVVALTYNAEYAAELYGPNDTVQLVVSNSAYSDTLTKVTSFSQAVKILAITPASAATGEQIYIRGEHFKNITGVTLGGVPVASFSVDTYGEGIGVVVGKGATGEVKVTSTKASSTFAGFTYIPPPQIISFSPAIAAKGDTVTLKGTGFDLVGEVYFNKRQTGFRVVSETEIRAMVPGGDANGNIILKGYPGADTISNFKLKPVISSLNVDTGRYNSPVNITGTGFYDVKSVTLDGKPMVSINVYNDTFYYNEISAVLGEGGTQGNLVITLNNGLIATYTGFKYYFSPVVNSFTPLTGNPGSQVTITGNNFSTVAADNFVYFGSVKAVVNSATATSLVVTVPIGAIYSPITVASRYATCNSVKYFTPTFNGGTTISANAYGALTSTWVGNNPRSLSIGDFNKDGKADISVTSFGESNNFNYYMLNKSTSGNISLLRSQSLRLTYGNGYNTDGANLSEVADWDLDGDLDVILAGTYGDKPAYVKAVFRDSVTYKPSVPVLVSSFQANYFYDERGIPTGLGIADMDGDGQADYLTSGFLPDHSLFPNLKLADLDSDGKADVLVRLGDTLAMYRNISIKNNIKYAPRVNILVGATISRIALGDFDNDGRIDIAMTVANAPGLMVWKNTSTTGNIALTRAQSFGTDIAPTSIAVGDLDGDGRVDIGISVGIDKVLLYPNKSGGNIGFDAPVVVALSAQTELAFGDLDGDSRPDLIALDPGGLNGIEQGLNIMRYLAGGPQITSFSPEGGPKGTVIEIKGSGLTGTTTVTIGGTTVLSFKVNSDSSITATAGEGSKGYIALDGSKGPGTSLSVFHFLPEPAVYVNGYLTQSAAFNLGDSASLDLTPYDEQFKFQWYKNGMAMAGATGPHLTAKTSGTYAGSMQYGSGPAIMSKPVEVRVILALPVDNFTVAGTNITCRGSKNGIITVTAKNPAAYTASITGALTGAVKFFTDRKIENLPPGEYNVCLTVDNYPEYQQCFSITISEPKDLSVYAIVNKTTNMVELNLDGSDLYNISVNGKIYTADNSVTLPLEQGYNKITISTDKPCQGIIEKVFDIANNVVPYPNPVVDVLNINLGNNAAPNAIISITNINGGRILYTKEIANPYGVLQVNMGGFQYGIYLVKLKLGNKESVYKITKR